MKSRSCGNCSLFTKLVRYSLCEHFDARTGSDSSFARKCPAYRPLKFVRKQEKHQEKQQDE